MSKSRTNQKSKSSSLDFDNTIENVVIDPNTKKVIKRAHSETKTREKAYNDTIEKYTGQFISSDDFETKSKKESQRRYISDAFADRMERLGMGGYYEGKKKFHYGVQTGAWIEIPNYKNTKCNPTIARSKRSSMLSELAYFVYHNQKKTRMLVIHDGPRCLSIDLKERWKKQNQRIRQFNKSRTAKKFGVSIIFRSNESGSPFKKEHEKTYNSKSGKFERKYVRDDKGNKIRCLDEKGRISYHPHTHALLYMERFLEGEEWDELIKFLQNFFKLAKPDAGTIADPREVCKYLIKSEDIMDLPDIDFMRHIRRTARLHVVQPLTLLKEQIIQHKADGLVVDFEMTHENNAIIRKPYLRPNWNSNPLKAEKTEGEILSEKLLKVCDKEKNADMIICSRPNPYQKFTPVAEPYFVVIADRFDPIEFAKNPYVKKIKQQTEKKFEVGCAAFEAIEGTNPLDYLDPYKVSVHKRTKSRLPKKSNNEEIPGARGSPRLSTIVSKTHYGGFETNPPSDNFKTSSFSND